MNAKAIRELDGRILGMAKYAASHGGVVVPVRRDISMRFKEYKALIMRAELGIDELDDLVRSRYGDPDHTSKHTFEVYGVRDWVIDDLALMPEAELTSSAKKLLCKNTP